MQFDQDCDKFLPYEFSDLLLSHKLIGTLRFFMIKASYKAIILPKIRGKCFLNDKSLFFKMQ